MTGTVNLFTSDIDNLLNHAYAKQDNDYPVVQREFACCHPSRRDGRQYIKPPLHNGVVFVLLGIRVPWQVVHIRGGEVDSPRQVHGPKVYQVLFCLGAP